MTRFPIEARLRKRGDYSRLKQVGRKVHTSGFLFLVHHTGNQARLGITVSSQVGNSVRRHRLKRLIKEAFRTHGELFPMGDIVVVAKTGCSADSLSDVLSEVRQAFSPSYPRRPRPDAGQ